MSRDPKPHRAHDRSQRLIFSHARAVSDLLLGFIDEDDLDEALELFEAAVPESPENKGLRRDLLAWLSKVVLPSRVQGLEVPKLRDLYEFRTYMESKMYSWSDRWKEEGIQQGVQQGISEGLERSLLNLLTAKFGSDAAKKAASTVRGASPEQIEAWMPRILTAETLDEVFRDPS